MAEKFTGELVWITMGGRLDVKHPDGRTIRTATVYGDTYERACALGKKAMVDVEISDFVPGAGRFDPRAVSIRDRISLLDAPEVLGTRP